MSKMPLTIMGGHFDDYLENSGETLAYRSSLNDEEAWLGTSMWSCWVGGLHTVGDGL